ncbi:hypothetical protein [Spirosoma endbachense]|uniref:Uncharacterized protein n=1 Tax=Spirosoma endbachense TaxID=2666025 RepID=A0A6P1VWS8_9BACT|nr:hypothetical protein [Spirosoma endbachense]QHV97563.1 hypothetical protein GJR95_22265 [Spirosoma endbachense]
MASVRIAQIGQTAVNQPFFEVVVNGKKYAFGVNQVGRVVFRSPAYLKQLGIYSAVAMGFEASPENVKIPLRLASDYSTIRDHRFPAFALGSGLAFVDAWSNSVGWKAIYPVIFQSFNE